MSKSKPNANHRPPQKNSAPPLEQQRLIAEQTEAFLAGGGQIQQIPKGVSGQPNLGGPAISLSAAPKKTDK